MKTISRAIAAAVAVIAVIACSKPAPAQRTSGEAVSRACETDADCKLWPVYCKASPCTCSAVATTDHPKPCEEVPCFADPCMKKKAQCQGGTCTVAPE